MTKNDIATALCMRNPWLTRSTALHLVQSMTDILSDAFIDGKNVYLRGFGSLEVRSVREKKARNISAGTIITVPAYSTVKFRISKQLKNRINNGC